jgi:hypothetical protein
MLRIRLTTAHRDARMNCGIPRRAFSKGAVSKCCFIVLTNESAQIRQTIHICLACESIRGSFAGITAGVAGTVGRSYYISNHSLG